MAYLPLATQLGAAAAFTMLWLVFIRHFTAALQHRVRKSSRYPLVVANQKRALYGMGFPAQPLPPHFPSGTTDELALHMYCFFATIACAHVVCALCMLPIALFGWEGSGEFSRGAFLIGILLDVGFDCQDMVTSFCSSFLPERCRLPRTPVLLFFGPILLHHPLAICLSIPMNLYHPDLPAFHRIAFSMLSAAAVGCGAGSLKLTLNAGKLAEFRLLQLLVCVQCAALLYARVIVWFPNALAIVALLAEDGSAALYRCGVVTVAMMSLFNVMMLGDALIAACKWITRPCPPAVAC